MATTVDSSGHTTRARSVVTFDGYVSRGRAPPPSVPRDHAMLQDFAVYLELRLKSQNLWMLRRIFADFLNEQENTLVPMMQQGCTIITVFPVLRTSAQRRQQAKFLLSKPKWTLDSRGCVFLYLQYRTATRNMALLKHMFLQFVYQRDTALMDFVQRGCQVISVIPFELPQLVSPVYQAPPPEQQVATDVAVEQKGEKRREGRTAASPRAVTRAVARADEVQMPQKKRLRRVSATRETTAVVADDSAQRQDVVAPRKPEDDSASVLEEDAAAVEGPDDAPVEEPEIVTKRRRKRIPVNAPDSETEVAAVSTPKRGRKLQERAASDESKGSGVATTAEPVEASLAESLEAPKAKRGRKRKADRATRAKEKSHRRGKPAMSDDICRSQLALTRKMGPFEAQIPWEAVYSNLPAPFDEPKHPELSRRFRKFWRNHARAVWERNFWAPMSRKTSLLACNKRSNRQLTAKNAFESVIISAYEELGAEFFVMLDTQKPRHPGWWYRGPVVVLFALQQINGEGAVWDYVKNEALERFPALPLKAPNSDAVSKRHKRDSESMWMANHQLTTEILGAIAALKANA
ncbi:hypothetical protein PRIC2_014026 [Phytophthora ramorum]